MSGFRSRLSIPSDNMAALVGHIVMDWPITEFYLRTLVCRLALTPELPGRALTAGLSAARSVVLVKSLLKLHEERYDGHFFGADVVAAIEQAIKSVESIRHGRNKFAHMMSFRFDDEQIMMLDLGRFLVGEPDNSWRVSEADLQKILAQVRSTNVLLDAALALTHEWSEHPVPEPF